MAGLCAGATTLAASRRHPRVASRKSLPATITPADSKPTAPSLAGAVSLSVVAGCVPRPCRRNRITGNGLNGPDGIVLTSWGELLVADYYGNTISRFSIDAQGNATSNGTISGNELSNPTSLALAPWGELFVGNQGTCCWLRGRHQQKVSATRRYLLLAKCRIWARVSPPSRP
jgi:hypothetical protein